MSWGIIRNDHSKSITRLFKQVDKYADRNNFRRVYKLLEKITSLTPRNENEWIIKSLAYDALENYDEAINCLEYVIQKNPNNAYAYMKLGKLFNSIFEFEKAQKCHEKWLELDPNKTIIPNKREKIKNKIQDNFSYFS